MTEYEEQLIVIANVARYHWSVDKPAADTSLSKIKIINRTGGKVSGILPSWQETPSVFFKVYFYDRGYRFEKAGLEAAAQMPQVEGVRTPNVIAVLPEYKAFLMERHTWEDTTSPWKRLWVNRLGIDWYKVGKWLRAFHDTQVTTERNDYFLRKKFEKFESHVSDLKHLFNHDHLQKIDYIFDTSRDFYETKSCEWVISHGDFGLANIKKSSDNLEIIDFEDCQSAPRSFDFLNCSTRMDYSDLLPGGRAQSQKIRNSILEGYGFLPSPSAGDKFLELLIRLDLLSGYYFREEDRTLPQQKRLVYKLFRIDSLNRIRSFLDNVDNPKMSTSRVGPKEE